MADATQKYQFDDDYFKDTTMSFGEHLEELRVRLIRALLGLAVGLGFGLYFANDFVQIIQRPVRQALVKYTKEEAQARIENLEIEDEFPGASSLVEQGYYFEPSYLDLGSISQAVGEEYPSWSAPTVPMFAARDLGDAARLCDELAAADGSAAAEHVASRLSAEQLAQVRAWADQDALSKEDEAELVAFLDELTRGEPLFDEAAFEPVTLSAEADLLVAKEERTTAQTQRLNRLLLTDVFPQAIAPPSANLTRVMIWKPPGESPSHADSQLGCDRAVHDLHQGGVRGRAARLGAVDLSPNLALRRGRAVSPRKELRLSLRSDQPGAVHPRGDDGVSAGVRAPCSTSCSA